jgi:hypothetical protein
LGSPDSRVADLGGGRDRDVVHPLRRKLRIAAQQLPDATNHQIIGAGLGIHAARLAERCADAINEDDLTNFTGHSKPPCGRARRCEENATRQ